MIDIEEIHAEYERRLRQKIFTRTRMFCFFALFALLSYHALQSSIHPRDAAAIRSGHAGKEKRSFLSLLGFQLDTLFTPAKSYLELALDSQKLYHHWRSGAIDSYLVSTGTSRLTKGIETPTGVFLIQNKIDWLYSLQFDSAKVFNWLGFNFGVGFHSLEGRRYYATLGKRPSSHGCVRLSRVDAERLFSRVEVGTPVIVHNSSAARAIQFSPDTNRRPVLFLSKGEARRTLNARLRLLLAGKKYLQHFPDVPLSLAFIGHQGVALGDRNAIPSRQEPPRFLSGFQGAERDRSRTRGRFHHVRIPERQVLTTHEIEQEILP